MPSQLQVTPDMLSFDLSQMAQSTMWGNVLLPPTNSKPQNKTTMQKEQSVERLPDLMNRRVKITNWYPGCPFMPDEIASGVILEISRYPFDCFRFDGHVFNVQSVERAVANFRELSWWEDRKPEEMPLFVKKDGNVFKIKDWNNSHVPFIFVDTTVHTGFIKECTESVLYPPYFPATKEEYEAHHQTK